MHIELSNVSILRHDVITPCYHIYISCLMSCRDYDRIGDDFVNLDFIPRGVDTSPIVPALALVFEAALAGGGAKSINFQELAAALADITFKFPFKIPPYFALIIRAISVSK
jgi:aarF domain-containing kinase